MRISVRYKLFIIAFVVLAINIVLGYAAYRSDLKLLESERWVQHSEQVMIQSANIRSLGREMQITSRDFLITDDSVFLEPLNHAQKTAFIYIVLLGQLTRDNPVQQKLIDSLNLYMRKLEDFSSGTISARNKLGLATVVAYTTDKKRKYFTTRINQITNAIQQHEDILLKVRKRTNAYNEKVFSRFSLAILILMAGFTILLVIVAGKYLYQAKDKRKRAEELIVANAELQFQNKEKESRAAELDIANDELLFQNQEKGNRAAELAIANTELLFQNEEKEKRAAELAIANTELLFQNEEKEKRAAELLIANDELYFQNTEKEKTAAELLVANDELIFLNNEKGKRADELLIANKEVLFQHDEKTKRAIEKEFDKNNMDALINNTNDLMWSVDRNFNLITSNQSFDNMILLMTGSSTVKGSNILDMASWDLRFKRYKNSYERAFAGEAFSETLANDALEHVWSEVSYYPIRKGNEIIGTACHSRDITERKINEENLVKSEKKLKEAQSIAHVGNFEIDMVQHSEVWSDQMYNILDIPNTYLPSTELLSTFVHPDDLTYVMTATDSLEDDSLDYRLVRPDGSLRYIYSEWKFEFDENKQPIRLYGILQDITERKLAEIERIKMVSELLERNKELEQFAYIVSHNLRAPVANIIGASNALIELGLTSPEKITLQKGIHTSVIKIDEVIHDLNYILQVKSKINVAKEVVNFSMLVDDIKVSISDMVDKNEVEIKYDFPEVNEYFTVKPYLYSIFLNLISNSVKYRRRDNHCVIEIVSHLLKDKIELTFSDNGMGINLDKKGEQIFGLYKRFHSNIDGRGIGLFMVKTQVETLGGKISIQSEENVGTEFKIEFEI